VRLSYVIKGFTYLLTVSQPVSARTVITMDARFSTVYSMSRIVLCLLVGSYNMVLQIHSVVIMHKEYKYFSVIRQPLSDSVHRFWRKILFDARTSAISLMQAEL